MPSPAQTGGTAGPYGYLPNPSLVPEKSNTYEFGADVNWNHVNASLTWFHSDWKDKIIAIDTTGFWNFQYQNLKDATLAGLEGSASVDVGKALGQNYSLSPYASFTWLETRKNRDSTQYFTFHGRENHTLPNTPEWMANYGINYAYPALKLKGRINAVYYGSALTVDRSVTGNPYISRPSGTVVNLSLEKELADLSGRYGKLVLRTEVNNLFDKANEIYWGYPGTGRSFYVGLRYDYN
jgi:vitamin B12 transporter